MFLNKIITVYRVATIIPPGKMVAKIVPLPGIWDYFLAAIFPGNNFSSYAAYIFFLIKAF